jgi:hypothetical protein
LASGVQLPTIGGFVAKNTAFPLQHDYRHRHRAGWELLNLTVGDHNRSEVTLHIRRTSSLSLAGYQSPFSEQRMEHTENSDEQTLWVS